MEIGGRCDFGLMSPGEVQMLHADDPTVDDHKRNTFLLINQLVVRYDFRVEEQLECLRATRGQEPREEKEEEEEEEVEEPPPCEECCGPYGCDM